MAKKAKTRVAPKLPAQPSVKPVSSVENVETANVSPNTLEIERHLRDDKIVSSHSIGLGVNDTREVIFEDKQKALFKPAGGEERRRKRQVRSRKAAPITDLEKARQLFLDAKLGFPTIPMELAAQLKESGPWVFSTRPVDMWPYLLRDYIDEVERTRVEDYALLSHSGHGVNSYAIQYYLVQWPFCLFFHHGWGGVYGNPEQEAANIRDCFSIADRLVAATQSLGGFQDDERLMIVASDFYGGYWVPPGEHGLRKDGLLNSENKPLQVLTQALEWVTNYQSGKM